MRDSENLTRIFRSAAVTPRVRARSFEDRITREEFDVIEDEEIAEHAERIHGKDPEPEMDRRIGDGISRGVAVPTVDRLECAVRAVTTR
jgi:hypothetical protein